MNWAKKRPPEETCQQSSSWNMLVAMHGAEMLQANNQKAKESKLLMAGPSAVHGAPYTPEKVVEISTLGLTPPCSPNSR
jgi:hypothetical protein